MREQYLALVRNGYCDEDEWYNAKAMFTLNSRYCKTLDEAQEWIDKAIKQGQELATKNHVLGNPPFSIESAPNEQH